ncbi:MAG: N-acetylmuramoyl-L-alanine amidase, partial [Fimbriimonadaceae bacterium]|nr:N-acetylmuramoyl-L-alanine amidase [Fimbriimonadaceae bacterium]
APHRLVIDLEGAEFDPSILAPLPIGWRAGQLNETTMRVVIEHEMMAGQVIPQLQAGRTLQFPLRSIDPNAVIENPAQPPVVDPGPPSQRPALISGPLKVGESAQAVDITIPVRSGRTGAPTGVHVGLSTIRITIPNSTQEGPSAPAAWEGRLIRQVTMRPGSGNSTQLILETRRPLIYDIQNNGDSLNIRVSVPSFAFGGLSGKTFVIDPGHGGNDPGAVFAGVREKDIALDVSLRFGRLLEREGVRVVYTRSTDVFIPLGRRSEIANEAAADLFISIHVNSNTVANTASGSKTFYHRQQSPGQLLSIAIEGELERQGRLRSMGPWSDTRIYRSGFAVLRNTRMPGVLVETGFINNSRDRAQLSRPEYRQQIADAILAALKTLAAEGAAD